LNLQKYQDKEVRVKFQGGREGEFGARTYLMPGIWSVYSCGETVRFRGSTIGYGEISAKKARQMEYQAGG